MDGQSDWKPRCPPGVARQSIHRRLLGILCGLCLCCSPIQVSDNSAVDAVVCFWRLRGITKVYRVPEFHPQEQFGAFRILCRI